MTIERIWLTGFMATGKSRVVRPLAAALDWTPIDLDSVIETEAHDSIAHIFKTGGEGAFQSITYGSFFTNETDDACMLSLDLARRLSAADQKSPPSAADPNTPPTADGPKALLGKTLTLGYAARAESGDAQRRDVLRGSGEGAAVGLQDGAGRSRAALVGVVRGLGGGRGRRDAHGRQNGSQGQSGQDTDGGTGAGGG